MKQESGNVIKSNVLSFAFFLNICFVDSSNFLVNKVYILLYFVFNIKNRVNKTMFQ